MSHHTGLLEEALGFGPQSPRQLIERIGISQPTLSRAINAAGRHIVRIGKARSIHYALRDDHRGLPDIGIYRISTEGTVRQLGTLIPVRPDGYVMEQASGVSIHSEGLPWWLMDMRPQGFLGRAWASHHSASLGLPENLRDWSDTHALQALLAQGHDVTGNLILGDVCRNRFISDPDPVSMSPDDYPALAQAAERGDLPSSSAGGEQPKFVAFSGGRHVLVKFSSAGSNEVSERWCDLLLAEHHALAILGTPSEIHDVAGRRFLGVERFDRIGVRGRRALHSLASLDAEFVGAGSAPWPDIVAQLVQAGVVRADALDRTCVLYAFGSLIGNTDMHTGNLSFIAEHGRPYALAPAYDMLPMGFAPRANGAVLNELLAARILSRISGDTWRSALSLAHSYLERLEQESRFSTAWLRCIEVLKAGVSDAASRISRLD